MISLKKIFYFNVESGGLVLLKIKKYIKEKNLMEIGDKILLAVSGGPDSVALMDIMFSLKDDLGILLHVIHLNHLFRGDEAEKDALFVKEEAEKKGIPVTILTFDVTSYKKKYHMSSQEAARKIRYGLFLKEAYRIGASKMAVAHHRDDQAETVLLNLLRGAGSEGLKGMHPIRTWGKREEKFIIRPLLEISRVEIENYLEKEGLPSRLDKSNLKDSYLRNKVRLRLFPLLEKEYNPSIKESFISLSRIMAETEDYLREITRDVWEDIAKIIKKGEETTVSLSVEKLLSYHGAIQSRLLRKSLKTVYPNLKNVGYQHIQNIRGLAKTGDTGSSLALPGKVEVIVSYGNIIFRAKNDKATGIMFSSVLLNVPGETEIFNRGKKVTAAVVSHKDIQLPINPEVEAILDYDTMLPYINKLQARRRIPGDRFQPLGLKGSKKLKDYLIDKKIPREERECLPIIATDDNIFWVVGLEINNNYKVKEKTKRILHLKIEDY